MKPILSLLLLSCFSLTNSFAQPVQPDPEIQAKMAKLAFVAGNWEGTGWMMTQAGKSTFDQTETIQYKLDSTLMIIEGVGMSNGNVVHNAYAIISYDKEEGEYSFRSYLPNGQTGEFDAELKDNKLYWYPNDNVRYIIWLNEKDQWYETGEYKNGENWMQFFEMTLDRID